MPASRTIALFLRARGNDYQERLREDCVATAARLGLEVEEHSADDDAEVQAAQIDARVRRNGTHPVAAILVSPVRESGLRLAAFDAARAGIPYALLNRPGDYLAPLRQDFPDVALFSISADQSEIGRIQGRQFRRLLPEGGDLLYIQGPRMTSSAQMRLRAMQDEIRDARIQVSLAHGDWSADGGDRIARRWARGLVERPPVASVVGAQNDGMAAGALRALRALAAEEGRPGLARVAVTGCDGSPDFGQKLVGDGDLSATVVIPSAAGAAVEAVARVIADGVLPPVELVLPVASHPPLDRLAPLAPAVT